MKDIPLHKRVQELEEEVEEIRHHIGLVRDEEDDDQENVSDDSDEADDEDE